MALSRGSYCYCYKIDWAEHQTWYDGEREIFFLPRSVARRTPKMTDKCRALNSQQQKMVDTLTSVSFYIQILWTDYTELSAT